MRKAMLFSLLFSLLLSCAACGANNAPLETPPSSPVETISPATVPPVEIPPQSAAPEPKYITVDTDYYTLSLPMEWEDLCCWKIDYTDGYGYSISFYETESHEAGYGGFLFCLALYTDNIDYTSLPSYEVLGSIEVYRINGFNLVAVYPTDVQFSEDNAGQYMALESQIHDVLGSISMKDESTFSPEPIPIYVPPNPEAIISGSFIGRWDCWSLMSSALPDGASDWVVEFRQDGTGEFLFQYEPGDLLTLPFEYTTYETPYMEGVQILVDSGTDLRLLLRTDWSNQQQTTLLTMYVVSEGTLYDFNNDLCWVFVYAE